MAAVAVVHLPTIAARRNALSILATTARSSTLQFAAASALMRLLVSSKTTFVTQRLAYASARYQFVIYLQERSSSPNSASAVQTSIDATDTRLTVLAVTLAHALVTHQLATVTRHSQPGSLKIATANVKYLKNLAQDLHLPSMQTHAVVNAISLFAKELALTKTHRYVDAHAILRFAQRLLQLSIRLHANVNATRLNAQIINRISTRRTADASASRRFAQRLLQLSIRLHAFVNATRLNAQIINRISTRRTADVSVMPKLALFQSQTSEYLPAPASANFGRTL